MRNARFSWNNHHLVTRAFLAFSHEVMGEEKQQKNNRAATRRITRSKNRFRQRIGYSFVKGLHLPHKYERLAINSDKKEREASDKDGRKKQQRHGIREIK